MKILKTDCILEKRKESPLYHLTAIFISCGFSTPFPSSLYMCSHIHKNMCVWEQAVQGPVEILINSKGKYSRKEDLSSWHLVR
jgi:hypothetical protein